MMDPFSRFHGYDSYTCRQMAAGEAGISKTIERVKYEGVLINPKPTTEQEARFR